MSFLNEKRHFKPIRSSAKHKKKLFFPDLLDVLGNYFIGQVIQEMRILGKLVF